jgi:ribosomal protein S18 acetylase RimI-like enzyme
VDPEAHRLAVIRCRPLELPVDRDRVARMNTTITFESIWLVDAHPTGFALSLRSLASPRDKHYQVAADELAGATCALVAESNDVVAGVASLDFHPWNRRAVLSHLYVDRDARCIGIGTTLLAELEQRARGLGARHMWVETQNINTVAVAFYQRCGFTLCGLDVAMYDPELVRDEAALFFVKPLAQ